MKHDELSNLQYWRKQFLECDQSLAFNSATTEDFNTWQESFRAVFLECLGRLPVKPKSLNLQVLEVVETAEFVRKKIVYQADAYSVVPAYLFVPKTKNREQSGAAIICPHGHGRGKDDTAGNTSKPRDADHVARYNYNYAEQFAVRGYVTLAPDLRCFGERVDDPRVVYGHTEIEEGHHSCDINFVLGMLVGLNLLTLHVFDISRAVDLLSTIGQVDRNRIGCVGLSLGGTAALFSGAYDERIRVVGLSGYLNSWKNFPLVRGQICGSQIVPSLLRYGDLSDVAGLICPRPLFVETAINDPIFPIDGSRECYRDVRKIYEASGHVDRLGREEFAGRHEFRGRKIFEFFDELL